MGRPRKRRREDVPPEQEQESVPDPASVGNSLPMPNVGASNAIPPANLTMDFPGFEGMPLDNPLSDTMIPPTYADTFGEIPTYDARSVIPSVAA